MSSLVMVGIFMVFLGMGLPIAYAMGLSAVLALIAFDNVPLVLLPQLFYTSIDNFSFLAIPLFVFAGALMSISGITDLLVRFSRAMIGHFRGGLAQANVLSNTCMAAVSGSATADVAAVGSIMIPAMAKAGYDKRFAVAVTSSAAMLAVVIPPSIVAVIYASMTGLSVGRFFMAGAVPGVLCALAILLLTRYYAKRYNMPSDLRSTWRERATTFLQTLPALVMPVIIIGGILGGIFTATEAGAVACLYAFIYCVYRGRADPRALYATLREAILTTGAALAVVAGSALFSWELVRSGAAAGATEAVLSISSDPRVALAIILGFLFLLGTVMEPVPALVLVAPLLVSATKVLGLDPLSFGVANIMMLILGSLTPPVGILAMIACRIANIPYVSTFRIVMPFIGVWLVLILLVAYVPWISNFLPGLME